MSETVRVQVTYEADVKVDGLDRAAAVEYAKSVAVSDAFLRDNRIHNCEVTSVVDVDSIRTQGAGT